MKSYYIVFELFPFANLALKTCNKDILKIIIASSFKRGQLIEGDQVKFK